MTAGGSSPPAPLKRRQHLLFINKQRPVAGRRGLILKTMKIPHKTRKNTLTSIAAKLLCLLLNLRSRRKPGIQYVFGLLQKTAEDKEVFVFSISGNRKRLFHFVRYMALDCRMRDLMEIDGHTHISGHGCRNPWKTRPETWKEYYQRLSEKRKDVKDGGAY